MRKGFIAHRIKQEIAKVVSFVKRPIHLKNSGGYMIHACLIIWLAWNIYKLFVKRTHPAGLWRRNENDVIPTSMRRDDVASTSVWRHFVVMCLLGRIWSEYSAQRLAAIWRKVNCYWDLSTVDSKTALWKCKKGLLQGGCTVQYT